MKHPLTRRGRLSLTLVTVTTIGCWLLLRGDPSFSGTFTLTLFADVGAVGLALVVSEVRPLRRIKTRKELSWK